MNKSFSLTLASVVLAALFFALVVINNQALDSVRVDLTENQVYSLSDGSKQVIDELDEPINLYFFFSDSTSKGMTGLRNYANRVESLLREYAKYSQDKIRLHVIDPVPFSEAEDQAAQYGLTGAAIGQIGESIYFGLAGTNAVDDQQVIGFFDPQKETFLEYDISQLVYQLSDPEPVNVAVLTSIGVDGGQNPMTGQFEQPMVFYTQLQQLFDVTKIDTDATEVPVDTDVLLVAHPKGINDTLLSSIERFATGDGRMIVFADPHYESDAMAMMGGMGANASAFPLLESWGISVTTDSVLLDASAGLEVRTPQGGVARHVGILGFNATMMDGDDVVTANLDSVNAASVGAITLAQNSELALQPLIRTTQNSQLVPSAVYAMTQDPQALARDFESDDKQHVVAARISGNVGEQASLNMIVIADADLLADRFWVQQSNFFGQSVFTPFANNGDLLTNATENLAGSDALISVRSRGTFARPFERVQALEVAAEAKFREQEELLQQQLAETEAQLAELQSQQGDTGALVVSPEQQAAIDNFVQQRIDIRKALRDVRYQLDRDIDTLGNWLKFINIAVAPMLLAFLLWGLFRLFRVTAKGRYQHSSATQQKGV
ncbi:GldG family protein [Alteromonas oceanisediminis]|uniref:GldG family protein n=1 Tax=Alteromonas oceanisediminis TaxID=2836180 RepID=UPI001BDAF2CE|nr:Gldg family protein [Alteromonas oceanisediminis]MBT0585755.1 Gldg family protein [Alteromonas oceanisediminis]